MLDAFAAFLYQNFPIHMFFSVQLLLAELLFVVGQKKRSHAALRICFGIVLYLVVCWFHPTMGHKFIRVLCIFAESYLLLLFCLKISAKGCLFIAIGAYAVQNLAYNAGWLCAKALRLESGSFPYYAATAIVFVLTYLVCYFCFARRFEKNGEILLKNTVCLILAVVTVFIVYSRNAMKSFGWMDDEALSFLFTGISCILILVVQFGAIQQSKISEQNRIIEQLLEAEKNNFDRMKETIDLVNMKCHDLRYHIREYREGEDDKKHDSFFREMEDSIKVYDSIARTGNSAVDVVLSQKLLLCEANGVRLSYLVDSEAIEKIDSADLYSLIGNALDNAIQSALKEEEDKRIVSLHIGKKQEFCQIIVENYCACPPEIVDGLPVAKGDPKYHGFGSKSIRYIAEKYQGSMVIDTSNERYILSVLIPL